jgi:hypothetical protein
MQNFLNDKKGASLVEIIATITITSIVLILIYNIFAFNIQQNKLNHEQTLHANIANGVYNFLDSQDYTVINTYLTDKTYAEIDYHTCMILFADETDCQNIFLPLINNFQYDDDNLYAFIIPYYGPEFIDGLSNKSALEIKDFLDDLTKSSEDITNNSTLTVVIIVESAYQPRYDLILKGVITKW